jgi:hypothetical protein
MEFSIPPRDDCNAITGFNFFLRRAGSGKGKAISPQIHAGDVSLKKSDAGR